MLAPGLHGNQDWIERSALWREQVFGARRMVGIEAAGKNAVSGKLFDPGGEHAGSEAGQAGFKVLEAASGVKEEISEDEDGPAVADDVEGASDGAAHGVFSRHGMVLLKIKHPTSSLINAQGLKPYDFCGHCGTTKVVPFHTRLFIRFVQVTIINKVTTVNKSN